jgi:hypothetical protein
MDADRDDAGFGLAFFPHGYCDTEDRRLERHGQVVLDHGGEPGQLLVLVVTVHRGLGDQRVQFRLAQLAHDRKRRGKPPAADKGVPNRLTPDAFQLRDAA